jgi:aminopeptidase-like protein
MGIQQFELFHGAVLAKLMRSDRPIALRMIETKDEAWSVYTVNDEVELFIKVRTIANELSRERDGLSWQFVFTPEQIGQIKSLYASKKVAIALVCGRQNIKDDMQIAFIEQDDVKDIISTSRKGLNMVNLVPTTEAKNHVQARNQDYPNNPI